MTEIVLSSKFRKAYKRKVRGNKSLETRFRDRAAIFQDNPFDQRLKTHKLSGELNDLLRFSIDYDV
jgi:mRNA-degrading endonuclease YafQ of YafQ-DinJ toxin-antitoxin module